MGSATASGNPKGELKGPNQGLPEVAAALPAVVLPTVGLALAALAVGAWSVWGTLTHTLPLAITIPVNAVVSFVMFTVLHDAAHHSMGRADWVNELFGRISMLFVVAWGSFGLFRFIHIEHHRNTNEGPGIDPDAWASQGPAWMHPLRWMTLDLWYVAYYARKARHRPLAEVLETGVLATLVVAGVAWAWYAGELWTLVVVYFIPQRIAVTILAWWFDHLPHHGLTESARQNRFTATRNRVGMEWLLTPAMLSQNYHLVHHLYPVIPFYRYVGTWRRHEEAFLARRPALSDVFGRQLSVDQYRAWRGLPPPLADSKAETAADAGARARFHPLRVAQLDRLTADSVAVSFEVPAPLAETFRFRQGQHLTLRCDLGGQGIRRNYSICASARGGRLRIGVKHIPGGAFSSHAMTALRVGDVLEVMPPSGRFFTQLDAAHSRFYVGISAGSGITPILSILTTTLETELESKFILLYGNRSADTIMFRDELQALKERYRDRFQVLHFLSRSPDDAANLHGSLEREEFYGKFDRELLAGRLDAAKLSVLLASFLSPADVNEWYLCGPQELVEGARNLLVERGVDGRHIHHELFIAAPTRTPGERSEAAAQDAPVSQVTLRAAGKSTSFELRQGGETVLDAGMQLRTDLPYACLGGACGTCRAKLCEGSVHMEQNYALDEDEVRSGYVLTCQSRPTSAAVSLDYDA